MYFGQRVSGHVVMAWLGFGLATLGLGVNKDILAGKYLWGIWRENGERGREGKEAPGKGRRPQG